jgi:hypothetical protein
MISRVSMAVCVPLSRAGCGGVWAVMARLQDMYQRVGVTLCSIEDHGPRRARAGCSFVRRGAVRSAVGRERRVRFQHFSRGRRL